MLIKKVENVLDLTKNTLQTSVALVHDALFSFVTSLVAFKSKGKNFYHRSLPCSSDNHWLVGNGFRQSILAVSIMQNIFFNCSF